MLRLISTPFEWRLSFCRRKSTTTSDSQVARSFVRSFVQHDDVVGDFKERAVAVVSAAAAAELPSFSRWNAIKSLERLWCFSHNRMARIWRDATSPYVVGYLFENEALTYRQTRRRTGRQSAQATLQSVVWCEKVMDDIWGDATDLGASKLQSPPLSVVLRRNRKNT